MIVILWVCWAKQKGRQIPDKTNPRGSKRDITWYNPPLSQNVATNIGKTFWKTLDKEFPVDYVLHKIFNKKMSKLSTAAWTISSKTSKATMSLYQSLNEWRQLKRTIAIAGNLLNVRCPRIASQNLSYISSHSETHLTNDSLKHM